jgi:hypothetical protein
MLRLAACTPLLSTKAESGTMKQSVPTNEAVCAETIMIVACCMNGDPSWCFGRKTKVLRFTVTFAYPAPTEYHEALASAKLDEYRPGPRKPAAEATALVSTTSTAALTAVIAIRCMGFITRS